MINLGCKWLLFDAAAAGREAERPHNADVRASCH